MQLECSDKEVIAAVWDCIGNNGRRKIVDDDDAVSWSCIYAVYLSKTEYDKTISQYVFEWN